MRIINDRQTGMFSYGEWICNLVGLNVEWKDSTAYGGIGWRGVAIPRVNDVESAVCKVGDVPARKLRPADSSDGRDLRVRMSQPSVRATIYSVAVMRFCQCDQMNQIIPATSATPITASNW